MLRPPPGSTLFPYTTLFRSWMPISPGVASGETALASGHAQPVAHAGIDLEAFGAVLHEVGIKLDPARLENGHDARAAELEQRSEEHTSELQSRLHLVCRLLL